MSLKLVMISDTHQLHHKIIVPEGDVLIHSGDFTNKGSESAIRDFLEWFSSQPHKYKVFINGNHELGTDAGPTRHRKLAIISEFVKKVDGLHYLENSSIVIEGVKFYGSPITPFFFNWAWNRQRGKDISIEWDKIPDDTQVLITHGPPYGILDLVQESFGRDEHQGCKDLLNRINELKELKVSCWGHLHLQGGLYAVLNNITFVNAAICDDNYQPTRQPVVVEI